MKVLPKITFLLGLLLLVPIGAEAGNITLKSFSESKMVALSLEKLESTLESARSKEKTQILLVNLLEDSGVLLTNNIKADSLASEGYQILKKGTSIFVLGGDEKGLMYGILDLRDQIEVSGALDQIIEKTENPRFPFRAVKFNLPWSSYRYHESLHLHMETVRDTLFWVEFLDMMADNRFNALTLWNLHPFTFMIQPENYPEAIQFKGAEFEEWRKFWKTLFRMAKERGIETYLINWNIFTSPQFTEAHDVANYKDDLEWNYGFTPADTSKIIVDYMRECVTQVINEYPNLSGLGVSVGERMKMPVEDAMQWIKDTFIEGMQDADRRVKFIHRAPFSIDPEVAREYIESYTDLAGPILMEFKFNWSHAHSSPNLSITHGGKIKDQYWNPLPTNYKMAWMMRNEDFFMLNWGNTDFIREHIRTNGQDFVAGYFVGSECYIPAREFRMKEGVAYDWKYAFQKQWEFYQMWGRLLYNPQLQDDFFADQMKLRYGNDVGENMFQALSLGSKMPLGLASFYQGTWDFTLYSEGFLNGKQIYRNYKEAGKAFIHIDEMIKHPSLDPNYLSIGVYTDRILKEKPIKKDEITPLMLADQMEKDGREALGLCGEIEGHATAGEINFGIEVNDIKAWAYLSLYFSAKLRGGVALDEAARTENRELQEKAIDYLEEAADHWKDLSDLTSQQYRDVSLLHLRTFKFSWKYFQKETIRDIEIAKEMF